MAEGRERKLWTENGDEPQPQRGRGRARGRGRGVLFNPSDDKDEPFETYTPPHRAEGGRGSRGRGGDGQRGKGGRGGGRGGGERESHAIQGTEGPEGGGAEGPRLILGAKTLQDDSEKGPKGQVAGAGNQSVGAGAPGAGIAKGPQVFKFLSERFNFVGEKESIRLLTENTDYTVIAIVGPAGSGKSSLINEIASVANRGSKSDETKGPSRKPFAVQTSDIAVEGSHQTVGIDLLVTAERLILLDCQPLLSSSVVLDMVLENAALPNGVAGYDELMHRQTIQMLVFLTAICHMVVVVQDRHTDSDLLAALRVAESFKLNSKDLWPKQVDTNQTADGEGPVAVPTVWEGPQFLFAYNMMEDKLMNAFKARSLDLELNSALQGTNLLARTSTQPVRPLDGVRGATGIETLGKECLPNLFLLPVDERMLSNSQASMALSARPAFQVYADIFVQEVLSMQKAAFPRPISEKEWCKMAGQAWDLIQKSPLLNHFLEGLQY